MSDGLRRVLRTLIQLAVAGAFTGLIDQLVLDLPTQVAVYLPLVFTLIVTAGQNWLEDEGIDAVSPVKREG